ncbi:MAG: CTP synthase [Bryobacterales bacterium]
MPPPAKLKTKPTQHSVKEIRAIGVQPDVLICRTETDLGREIREKIAAFCDVDRDAVIAAPDVESVYQVPVGFADQNVDEIILRLLRLDAAPRDLGPWKAMLDKLAHPHEDVTIAIVGKYVDYEDSYKSLKESLLHGGLAHQVRTKIRWVEAESITPDEAHRQLGDVDGILVPGGFGERGIEGMLEAIRYARESGIPYFGICLGMQTMVIEFVRNVCGVKDANSTEFAPDAEHRVFFKLRELKGVEDLGGTMRLGSWPCVLGENTLALKAYGKREIHERHRHRYEFNREFDAIIQEKGMRISGETPDRMYVEICELPSHPWYLGCQFHPEFKSKPLEPHPLFASFMGAAYERRKSRVSRVRKSEESQFLRSRG